MPTKAPKLSCPIGSHLVREHIRHDKPSKNNPTGISIVSAYCRKNRGHKYDAATLQKIADEFVVKKFPVLKAPKQKYSNQNKFDNLISGWTDYWNNIFKTNPSLDPNIVKALIASESSFNSMATNGKAKGLMQLLNNTITILSDDGGEIKEHRIEIKDNEIFDPNVNIAAGIRWLFRKREIATHKYGKNVDWDTIIAYYKNEQKKPINKQKETNIYRTLYREMK